MTAIEQIKSHLASDVKSANGRYDKYRENSAECVNWSILDGLAETAGEKTVLDTIVHATENVLNGKCSFQDAIETLDRFGMNAMSEVARVSKSTSPGQNMMSGAIAKAWNDKWFNELGSSYRRLFVKAVE